MLIKVNKLGEHKPECFIAFSVFTETSGFEILYLNILVVS